MWGLLCGAVGSRSINKKPPGRLHVHRHRRPLKFPPSRIDRHGVLSAGHARHTPVALRHRGRRCPRLSFATRARSPRSRCTSTSRTGRRVWPRSSSSGTASPPTLPTPRPGSLSRRRWRSRCGSRRSATRRPTARPPWGSTAQASPSRAWAPPSQRRRRRRHRRRRQGQKVSTGTTRRRRRTNWPVCALPMRRLTRRTARPRTARAPRRSDRCRLSGCRALRSAWVSSCSRVATRSST